MSAHSGIPQLPACYWRELWRFLWQTVVLTIVSLSVAFGGIMSRTYLLVLIGWIGFTVIGIAIARRFARNVRKEG